ncbi:hypothetical protein [Streptobacillus canis]|uniref:hypothetical protein n=1 Tax=Streptobacillus canis TaxID=2678686 RepID=UPI0012E23AA6|nr:hypothetical protein [Streptobacillus canis]
MKKTLLGVLALTSVASFANVTGYVKSDSKAEVKSEDITSTANPVVYTYDLSTKLDLGLFLDANKDTFVFAGGELKGKAVADSLETPGYLGVRYDGKVTENSNMSLTGAYRIKDANVKDAIIEHLKAKKIWNDKASDDDKNALLREQGYSFDKDDTLLLSGVGNGKYDNINYRLGMIYTTKDFANGTHKLESFVKADTKLEKFDVAAELTHKLGNFKTNTYNGTEIKDDVQKATLVTGGNLKGEVKVSSDRLVKDLSLESKAHFNLGTVLPFADAQVVNVGLENKAVYKGVKGLELTGKLNYGADVVSKYDPTPAQVGNMTHTPEAFVGVKYIGKNFMVSTENTDKVTVKHDFATKPVVSKLDNFFKTDNKLEVKPVEMLTLRARAFNILSSKDLKVTNTAAHTNSFVGALGHTLSPKLGKVVFTHNLDVAYRLENLNVTDLKAVTLKDHELFAWTTNKLTYAVTDAISLEGNLNVHTYNKIGVKPELLNTFTFVEGSGKVAYKHGRVDFSQELIGKFKHGKSTSEAKLWAAETDSKLNYQVTPNIQINSGLNLYATNKFVKAQHVGAVKFIESQGLHEDKFLKWGDYLKEVKIGDNKIEKNIADEKADLFNNTNIHFVVKPMLGVTMKFLDNKLTVKPAVEAKVIFRGVRPDFAPAKFDTKGTLNVEYVW